jgi:probable rRNA maturation factor|nr:rRNA maturation RNase YbeY [Candidatus Krumholzibacteria bacterium]
MKIEVVDWRLVPPAEAEDWFGLYRGLVQELATDIGPPSWKVDLVLVDDNRMVELNKEYRFKDGPTDVLSFSYNLEEHSSQGSLAKGQYHAACNLVLPFEVEHDGDHALVGELVIAPEFVTTRCHANGWSVAAEFPLLVVHGLLHIMGWEHDTAEKKSAMQDLEEEILAAHKLTHPMRPRS